MIIEYLLQLYKSILLKIEKFTNRKNWQLELTLLIPLLALFFSFPSYEYMFNEQMSNWKYIFQQSAHPFAQNNYAPITHQAKLTFRLFVPIIIRLLHLNIVTTSILEFVCGIAIGFFFVKSVMKITNNKVATVIFTLAFVSTAICKNPFNDIYGYLDGFALFFLIIPFAYNNPILIFMSVFFASWVDERGFIASSLIFVWILFIIKQNKKIKLVAIVLAWILYITIRLIIAFHYQLTTETDGVGLAMLLNQVNNAPLGTWTGLEGFWLLILFSIIGLLKQGRKVTTFFFIGSISIIVLVALSVIDITRSMIYLLPSIFIALSIIKETEKDNDLVYIATFVFLLCALFPQLTAGGYNAVNWQYPFPLQMIRYIYNSLII